MNALSQMMKLCGIGKNGTDYVFIRWFSCSVAGYFERGLLTSNRESNNQSM